MGEQGLSVTGDFAGRLVLPNGLAVLLKEVKALPSISMNLIIESGALLDPEGKEGLSAFTTEGVLIGTEQRTAAEISEEMDFTGGSLTARAGKDYCAFTLNVLKKALPTGLEILSDVLKRPVFPPAEVEKKRGEFQARIRKDEEDPGALAQKTFLGELFHHKFYGRPSLGTEASISGLSREDLLEFYRQRLSRSRAICSIVGQITEDELIVLSREHMQSWPAETAGTLVEIPPGQTGGKRITKIDRELTQANIVLGHKGIPRNHPDYYSVFVMNHILGGGGFRSRLMNSIREERGLAYSIYSMFASGKHAGYFQVMLETKNSSAAEAIDQVLKEMESIRSRGITDEELDEVKLYLTGSFPLKIDTNTKIANLLADIEFYGLGLDYPERFPEIINALSKTDVEDAAKKYLDPENYTVAIVGKQEEIKWG
ncbi:MAG: pitrilysin family protein [Pseudomonadota bacterium]